MSYLPAESNRLVRYLGAATVIAFADYLLILTDCIIAGRVLGETALGAMNLLMPIFSAVTFLSWLLAAGASSLYQLALRKQDERHCAEIASLWLTSSFLLALTIGGLLYASSDAYLAFMAPGAEICRYYQQYLKWYFVTLALQSVGMQLLYLVFIRGGQLICIQAYAIQLIANMFMSYWLCERFGIAGISLGTTASSLAWFLTVVLLLRNNPARPTLAKIQPDLLPLVKSVRSALAESSVWLLHALWRRMKQSQVPEARLNYLQNYIVSRIELDSQSQMFNLAKLFRLRRSLDLGRLSAALTAAGEAHSALHTVFRRDAEGELVQRQELAAGAVRCPIVKTTEAELMSSRTNLVKIFEIEGQALFEATIFDCGDGVAYLLSNFHHLICDGYSFPLILADAHRAWNGETLENDTYYEVLARREERAAQPIAVASRSFMRELLKDRSFTTLPPDDFHGNPGYGVIELPIPLPPNFETVLATRRTTRHHLFLAAAALALKWLTDADDVLIDWVFHGRVSKDELKTVGAFMVDLPLVFDGTEDLTASDMVALVKRATFNGIKSVNVFRNVSDCNPTGQDRLTFIYQDEWGELISAGPVRPDGPFAWMIEETIPLTAPRAATENPFNVEIMEHRDATRLFIEYDTGRYSEATVRRYADQFQRALNWLLS